MWYKALFSRLLIAVFAGSNPSENMDVHVFVVCCAGSGLCDGLITCSEEYYCLCVCVCVCVRARVRA
jgi:hypothetical protein